MTIAAVDASQAKITQSKITRSDKWDASSLWGPACASAVIKFAHKLKHAMLLFLLMEQTFWTELSEPEEVISILMSLWHVTSIFVILYVL